MNLSPRKTASRPDVLDLSRDEDRKRVEALYKAGAIQQVGDDYEEQLRELYAVNNPSLVYAPGFEVGVSAYIKGLAEGCPLAERGRWIFYPWLAAIVHVLEDADFQKVRTARNRELVTVEEQKKFYDATIGIGGLSVGSSVALALALQGGGRRLRIADFDRFALSNANRIRAGVENLGLPKVEIVERQVYELNPYASVEVFPDGLSGGNLDKFFAGPPQLDIMIDELDNLAVKYLIREKAKKYHIPLVMGADNGDNAVVDIERYDKDPDLPFFHGRLGDVAYKELLSLDKLGIGRMITKHIGPENITARLQQSLLQIGKTIVSWPQFGGAALLNSAAVAYCVRKIVNDEPIEPDRAIVSFDEKFVPGYNSPAAKKGRADITASFKKTFGL